MDPVSHRIHVGMVYFYLDFTINLSQMSVNIHIYISYTDPMGVVIAKVESLGM